MKLYQLIAVTINPFETIIVFDEDSSNLYDLSDFVSTCLKIIFHMINFIMV